MNLNTYKLKINKEEKESGVFAISIVESPAIESNFMFFTKEEKKVNFTLNEDEQIITGPSLIPDILIPRKTEKGDFYQVTIDAETIKEVAIKFFKEGYQNNTTLQHQTDVKDTTYFESWIITDPKNDKSNSLGFKNLTKGTWMVSLKINSDELWSKIKSGDFYGFSIEGFFEKELIQMESNKKEEKSMFTKIVENLKKLILEAEGAEVEKVEVKYEDLKLEDGTIIRIAEDKTASKINEDGTITALEDGEYTLAPATEGDEPIKITIKEGKKVEPVAIVEEAKVEVKQEEVKEEAKLSKEEFEKISSDFKIALEKEKAYLSKIQELELKIVELGKEPAAERTAIVNNENTKKTDFVAQTIANIKKSIK